MGKMSWLRYMTLESFCLLNPDWVVNLYYPVNQRSETIGIDAKHENDNYLGGDYRKDVGSLRVNVLPWIPPFENISPADMSDLFEWEILRKGGFYADMDILWIKPLDIPFDADAVFCLEKGMCAVGFFGSARECRIFRDIQTVAEKRIANKNYPGKQCCGSRAIYRMLGMDESHGVKAYEKLLGGYPEYRVVRLPDAAVYPLNWHELNKIWNECSDIPDDALGIHWFGGGEASKLWSSILLTKETWRNYDNTITRALQRII